MVEGTQRGAGQVIILIITRLMTIIRDPEPLPQNKSADRLEPAEVSAYVLLSVQKKVGNCNKHVILCISKIN